MKKSTIVWAIVAVCALGGGLARGETAEGRSRNFPVDTRCKEFVIADVKSAYCSGAYGMKGGKRAIFLQGVEAQVAFTVTALGNNVKLTRVTANGRDFEGAKFIYDVGALPVGGKLMVVGYGEVDGVEAESAPFMVNLDVVWPLMVYGLTGLDLDFAGEQGYREKGATQFEIGSDALSSSNHPGWLPEGVTQFSPLVAFRTDYSEDNGAFVFSPRAHSSRGTKKIPSQRSNGMLGKSFGIGYEMQADGGMTFQWLPEARGWLAKRAALTGEVGGQMEFMWPFTVPTPVGGIPAFAEVEVAAEAKTRLAYRFPGVVDGMSQAASWNWTLSGAKMPTLSGDLGVGGTPLADVKGWVAATGVLAGTIDGSDDSRIQYGVRGKLSGTVDALGWRAKISTDPATHWILGGEDTDDAMGEVKVEWGPMGREYWKRPGASGATVMGGVTGGYPNPSPSAAWGGGADWMAYLRDDGTRGNADRTEVVVQPGAGGKWGAVERPWNDGTADWMPSLSVAGDGTAVLAWANEKRAWGASAGFEDMCRGLELAVGVRDAKKRCWAVQNLTDDEAADAGAVVRAAGDGTAMVAWLRNASGALFGDAERPTDVMASWWNGSEWSAPEVVAAKVGAVSGLDLAYDGTNACAVWAFDGDGDWMTHGDMAVGAAIWIGGGWEDPTTTEEDGEGALPVVSQVDQNGYLATAGVETEEEEEGWTNGVWKAAVAMAAGLESASPVVARVDGIGAVALWNAGGVLMERTADGTEKTRAA